MCEIGEQSPFLEQDSLSSLSDIVAFLRTMGRRDGSFSARACPSPADRLLFLPESQIIRRALNPQLFLAGGVSPGIR